MKTFSRITSGGTSATTSNGAILGILASPPINLGRLATATEKSIDLGFDLAASHADALAKQEQQALGRLEPAPSLAVDIKRNYALLRDFDSN